MNLIYDFMQAAAPWVAMGIGVAIVCAFYRNKKD